MPDLVPPSDRKARLHCQRCGHASPPDGDWVVRTTPEQRVYRCPDCDHVVEDRPTFDDAALTAEP